MKAIEGLAEAYGEECPGRLPLEEKCVGVDSRGQQVELIQPSRIGNCQIVTDAANLAETKERAVPALALLIAYRSTTTSIWCWRTRASHVSKAWLEWPIVKKLLTRMSLARRIALCHLFSHRGNGASVSLWEFGRTGKLRTGSTPAA
jgi:hypothetical protein